MRFNLFHRADDAKEPRSPPGYHAGGQPHTVVRIKKAGGLRTPAELGSPACAGLRILRVGVKCHKAEVFYGSAFMSVKTLCEIPGKKGMYRKLSISSHTLTPRQRCRGVFVCGGMVHPWLPFEISAFRWNHECSVTIPSMQFRMIQSQNQTCCIDFPLNLLHRAFAQMRGLAGLDPLVPEREDSSGIRSETALAHAGTESEIFLPSKPIADVVEPLQSQSHVSFPGLHGVAPNEEGLPCPIRGAGELRSSEECRFVLLKLCESTHRITLQQPKVVPNLIRAVRGH